jgi:hypothetical protein
MGAANSTLATVGGIGVGGIVAGLLLPVAQRLAIHMGWSWLTPPPSSPAPSTLSSDGVEALTLMREDLKVLKDHVCEHSRVIADTLKTLNVGQDRLISIGEAQSRDGEVLIYRRVPPPAPDSAAGHLVDG